MAAKKPSTSTSRVSPVLRFFPHALHRALAQHVLHHRVEDEGDLGVVARPVHHDLGRPEGFPAVDDQDLRGELRQEERLLHRRVPAAHHRNLLVAEEEPVAGGAAAHAAAHEPLLTREPEPLGLRARGDHDALGQDGLVLALGPQLEGPLGEVHALDLVGAHLGPEALGLGLEVVHHLGAAYALPVAREVLDVGGEHELPAALEALEDQRVEVGSRRVQRRRVAGGAGPYDSDVVHP
jgi:hypothetical protein